MALNGHLRSEAKTVNKMHQIISANINKLPKTPEAPPDGNIRYIGNRSIRKVNGKAGIIKMSPGIDSRIPNHFRPVDSDTNEPNSNEQ